MSGKKNNRENRLKAAALRYDRRKEGIPRMIAKGDGLVAEKIIALAEEHGIPITRDPDLVTILSKMDLGQAISPDLYEIVAELLVFIYRLKEKWAEQKSGV